MNQQYPFKLRKAYFLIQKGFILSVRTKHGRGEIWLDGEYIKWQCYGSSAQVNNIDELKWLFDTIFKSMDYIVFTSWCDYNLAFNTKDDRAMWLWFGDEWEDYSPEIKIAVGG